MGYLNSWRQERNSIGSAVFGTPPSLKEPQTQRSRRKGVNVSGSPLSSTSAPAISERQIWLIAIGLIALDLIFFMVPIVPFLAAYVLIVRPPWFKDFVDDLYD